MKRLLFLLFLFSKMLNAQTTLQNEVVASGGQTGTISGAQVSYTVGEAVVATVGNDDATLTQGFQQGNLAIVALGEPWSGNSIRIFPNPTAYNCNIEFSSPLAEQTDYQLFDEVGRLVLQGPIPSGVVQHSLDLQKLPPGAYQLQMRARTYGTALFSIIKI
jgi:Secretion system C-terminal sorting domain